MTEGKHTQWRKGTLAADGYKVCSSCGERRPITEYAVSKIHRDGLCPSCKPCNRARGRAYYQRNRDHVIARTRQYQQEHPDVRLKAKRAFNERHKERLREEAQSPESRAYHRAYSAQHYRANLLSYRLRVLKYQADRPEWRRRVAREWQRKNPDRTRIYGRTYQARHPERLLIKGRRYRARKRHAPGQHTAAQWEALKAQYGYRCLCCGVCEPEITLTADHIVPLVHGGSDDVSNLQPLCLSCNSRKGHWRATDYRP